MAIGTWLRVLDAISGASDLARRIKGTPAKTDESLAPGSRMLGQVEARLAGVVVAALKEAFDRDSARMELERAQIEAERRRAEEALRLEALRQAGDRQVAEARLVAVIAIVVWVVSALIAMRLAAGAAAAPKTLLAIGWLLLLAAVGCTFRAQSQITAWMSAPRSSPNGPPPTRAGVAAPWLLLGGLAVTGASILLTL